MKKNKKFFLIGLIALNSIVLLGQIWPEGAPSFAYKINITFLIISLLYFFISLISEKKE